MKFLGDKWVVALSGTGLIDTIRLLELHDIPYKIQHKGDKTIDVLVPKQYLPKVKEIEQWWPHGYDED